MVADDLGKADPKCCTFLESSNEDELRVVGGGPDSDLSVWVWIGTEPRNGGRFTHSGFIFEFDKVQLNLKTKKLFKTLKFKLQKLVQKVWKLATF